jgi:hypothetical protein
MNLPYRPTFRADSTTVGCLRFLAEVRDDGRFFQILEHFGLMTVGEGA